MVDDPRLRRGSVVVFGQFCIFSLPFIWLTANVGIIGLGGFFVLCGCGERMRG